MHNVNEFNEGLLDFLSLSTTPFHAVSHMASLLEAGGFQRLYESDRWSLAVGKRYYVIRHDSSLCAFVMGERDDVDAGIRMMGAHTDSPCLKVKPQPEKNHHGYFQLGVEVYGGVLLNPWFDRDLSLAGRLSVKNSVGAIEHHLIDYRRPIAVVPSLAIHLDREANKERSINAQQDLPPILMQNSATINFREELLRQLLQEHPHVDVEAVIDYDLCFYDVQPPDIIGLNSEFIASARLDNLISCYTGLMSLLAAEGEVSSLLICNDHEEVGSVSGSGAQGTFLRSVLDRISQDAESFARLVDRSFLISTDNAHAIHPNFADRHDRDHGPLLNQGPVIKVNANQRYASTGETSALFRLLCERADVPVQLFAMRSDLVCGSTIGPLTAAQIGVRTLDVGVPTLAMHSIRELAGVNDGHFLFQVLTEFCNTECV